MIKGLTYPAPGKLVSVNGHDMHVFSEGQGEKTFVFMAGGGTSCPALDFKPLWSLLSDKHKIVVVEKAGYGWSELARDSRDLDTILYESREALQLAGVNPPYYLVPHSMSGLEAIYWAQKYPSEVKAIIGLDPGIPDMYDVMKTPPMFVFHIIAFFTRLGVSTQKPSALFATCEKHLPSFQSTALTDDDRAMYVEIFRRSTFTSDMLNEIKNIREYVKKPRQNPLPFDLPVYFFISNGEGMHGNGIKPEDWVKLQKNFLSNFKNVKYLELSCGHYVHSYEPAKIADEINAFVDGIN